MHWPRAHTPTSSAPLPYFETPYSTPSPSNVTFATLTGPSAVYSAGATEHWIENPGREDAAPGKGRTDYLARMEGDQPSPRGAWATPRVRARRTPTTG